MLFLRVLELRVREAAQRLHEQHDGRDAGARDLGRVVERPLGRRCDVPATSRIASSASSISASSKRIGSMFQIRSHSTSMPSSCANRSTRLRVAEHRRELRRVEVALVEQALGRLDDRRDDPRLRDDAAHRADRAAAGRLAISRISSSSCAAPASASRRLSIGVEPGVRGLAAERDLVALDAERAEHDAERQVHRLEHRALLDVQLEVGRRALELRRARRAPGRGRRRAPQRVGQRDAVGVLRARSSSWSAIEPAAADEPKSERPKRAPSSSAQLTSRTVAGGSPSSASRRSTSTPATTLSAPSSQPPFGTESMCPPIRTRAVGRAAQREPLVARRVDLLLGAGPATLPRSHSRARSQVSVHATRCAPFSSPVSSWSSRSSATVRLGWSGTRRL